MGYDMSHSRPGNRAGYAGRGGYSQPAPPKEIEALPIPTDYVDEAEKLMSTRSGSITTSKLRNFLSLAADIYNTEQLRNEKELLSESLSAIQFMRIRIVYECGRDRNTRDFIEAVKVLEYIKGIGTSREALIRFYHYLEAIVAYHRYFGGKEN